MPSPAHDEVAVSGAAAPATPASASASAPAPTPSPDLVSDAPKHAVSVAARRKEPPPEKPENIRRRTWVIASFWSIVLFLGLPVWWATTNIYRAALPLDLMNSWADGTLCRPVIPLQISLEAPYIHEQEAQNLLRATQHALDDLNDFSAHHLRLQMSHPANGSDGAVPPIDGDVALVIRLLPSDTTYAVLMPYSPVLEVYYSPNHVPSTASSSSILASFIAKELREIFEEEQDMVAYLLSTSSAATDRAHKTLAPDVADRLAKRTTRTMKFARTYHLTFSLFTAGGSPSSWNIEEALEEYVKPLLHSLSPVSNFTIDTQVQLYATPGVSGHVLKKEDLSSFINAAEWPLSPSIGGAPTINFVLFVGDIEVEGGSKSWLIPQWGGVVIQPDVNDLRPAMLTFSNQLLALLGAPEKGSLPLRIMTLIRVRSASLVLKASSTLGSLARLTLALPSISIPESVADGTAETIHHLEKACASLGGTEGLEHAQIAEEAAEKAFFEKSMVGQVYFPDEHKVAVYLPLLGPVGVPLVMVLIKELKSWKKIRKASSA